MQRFALPNILSGKDLAPELIQDDCTPDRLAEAVLGWLRHPQAVTDLLPDYAQLHALLKRDASARAAEAVDALIASHPGRP